MIEAGLRGRSRRTRPRRSGRPRPGRAARTRAGTWPAAAVPSAASRPTRPTGVTTSPPKKPAERVGGQPRAGLLPEPRGEQHDEQPAERAARARRSARTRRPRRRRRRATAPSRRACSAASLVIATSDGTPAICGAGDDPEAQQHQLHRPGHELARAADHLARRQVERGGRQQAAGQEGHERRDQHAHRAVDRPFGREPERERADERRGGDREQHARPSACCACRPSARRPARRRPPRGRAPPASAAGSA